MRIGLLTHNYPRDSKERKDAGIFIYDFAHELAKKHEVYIFCPDFGGKKEKYKRVPVTWFDWGGGGRKFGSWLMYSPLSVYWFFKLIFSGSRQALEFIEDNKIDYCLAAWTLPSGVFAWVVNKKFQIPYATWSLGSDLNKFVKYPILRQLIGWSVQSADICFANSFLLCDKVKHFTSKPCVFMPAITDFQIRSAHKIKIDKKLTNFLFVGRLEKVKGLDILIDACRLLSLKSKKYKLFVLGSGSMENVLRRKSEGLNVHFFGNASKDEVAGYMKAADCLVIPSRSESLPLVLLEAARMGLPFVATDVGDNKRLSLKYKVGLIVEKENPNTLSEAMLKVIKYKGRYKSKTRKGLKELSLDFTQKKAVGIFLKSIR